MMDAIPAFIKWLGSFILGGGALGLLNWWRASDQQEHQQDLDLRGRLDKMADRIESLQQRVDEEIRQRREAQTQNARLRRQVAKLAWRLDQAVTAIERLTALLNAEREECGKEPLDTEQLGRVLPGFWEESEEGQPPYAGDIPAPRGDGQ